MPSPELREDGGIRPLEASLRGQLAAGLANFVGEPWLAETGFPGLLNAHQGKSSASQREILHKIHHVVHALVGILVTPEIMHDGRYAGEKPE